MGGRYTVSLAVAHTLLIIWGYAVTAHESVVPQTGALLTQYPDVHDGDRRPRPARRWSGSSRCGRHARACATRPGTTCTSTPTSRSRCRSVTSSRPALDFMCESEPRALLWSALYIARRPRCWSGTGSSCRCARWCGTAWSSRASSLRHQASSRSTITGRHLDELRAEAGQFFRWRFLTRDHWWQSHPYSLSAPPTDRLLRITVKALGDHSHDLADLRPGTRVFAEGPYGALTSAAAPGARCCCWPAASASRRCARCSRRCRRGPGELTLLYRAELRRRHRLSPRARRDRRLARRARGVPGRTARRRRRSFHRTPIGRGRPGRRRARRLPVRAATHDGRRRAALRRVGVPPAVHTESFEF